jgi:hypothetical protein
MPTFNNADYANMHFAHTDGSLSEQALRHKSGRLLREGHL